MFTSYEDPTVRELDFNQPNGLAQRAPQQEYDDEDQEVLGYRNLAYSK